MKSNGVMPISPRQKDGKDRNPRSLEDEYVVFLQGIPPQCRWQELKDFVRQTALHIRQAVVYDDCHGHPTGLGQIIVKNEDEAWRTYNRLSTNGWNGHSLTVTLSLASEPTKPIAGPTKSPSLSGMPYASGFSVPPVTSAPMGASPACVPNQDMPASPTFTQPPDHQHPPFMAPLPGACHPPYVQFPDSVGYHVPLVFPGESAFFVPHPAFYPPSFDSYQFGQPRYMTNNCIQAYPSFFPHRHSLSGPSVGVASGMNHEYGTPISRNIFIHNLSHETTPQLLKEYLRTSGIIERCDVFDRKIGGSTRTCAIVAFRNKEEAKRAIALFDNSMFRGSRIRVRFDRERGGSLGTAHGNGNGYGHGHNNNPNRNGVAKHAISTAPAAERPSAVLAASVPGGTARQEANSMPPPTMATTPGTPTKEAQQSATESPSPSLVAVTPTSTADEAETKSEKSSSSSSRKNSTEPLVVNGSCVGTKSPVTGIEKDELSQRTLALHL
ncbi:RRM domain-containing protein [Trichophyton interdigitale]|nr:RRM domain-containing protein [Trichophyton interdigitale]KAG5216716.1 RRM domain-containing protein [Trichophyton interdigitale]KAG8205253.1 RRM domain-containing protein [Trichophyton interdigitale]